MNCPTCGGLLLEPRSDELIKAKLKEQLGLADWEFYGVGASRLPLMTRLAQKVLINEIKRSRGKRKTA